MGSERNEKGQFVKGNKGGPGRPPRVVELTYFGTLEGNLTQERWAEIVGVVVGLAEGGDLRAFEALAKYVLPPQEQRLKMTGEALRVVGMDPREIDARLADRLGLLAKATEGPNGNGNGRSPKTPG